MDGLLTRKEGPLDIDGKQPIKFIFPGVCNRSGDTDPGIVYQDIQPAKMLKGPFKKPLDAFNPGNIRLHSYRCSAAGGNRCNNFISLARTADGWRIVERVEESTWDCASIVQEGMIPT